MSLTVMAKNATNGDKNVPMTVPIEDENRAMLAYNVLAYMHEKAWGDGEMTWEKGNSFVNILDRKDEYYRPGNTSMYAYVNIKEGLENIILMDENGNTVEPVIDPEILGTNQDSEAEGYTLRSTGSVDKELEEPVSFGPKVADYVKANEIANFMEYGLLREENSVTLITDSEDEENGYTFPDLENLQIVATDDKNVAYFPYKNPKWANETGTYMKSQEDDNLTLTEEDLSGIENTDGMEL